MSDINPRNPFPVRDNRNHIIGWQWRDENNVAHHTVYKTQLDALEALLRYIKGPTTLQRLWSLLKDVARA